MKMPYLLLLFSILVSNSVTAQYNIQALFAEETVFDHCSGIIETANEDLIFLKQVKNYPEIDSSYAILANVDRSVLNDGSFTSLYRFGKDGSLKSKLSLNCSDSIYYYGYKLIELNNGDLLVAGEVTYLSDTTYDIFYAIIAPDLSSIKQEKIIKPALDFNESLYNLVQKSNGNILLYYVQFGFSTVRLNLISFDLQGNQENQYYNFNSILNGGNQNLNIITKGDAIYNVVPGSPRQILEIDANNQLNSDTIIGNFSANLAYDGIQLGNSYYIDANLNNAVQLYKFENGNNFSLLFEDNNNVVSFGAQKNRSIAAIDSNFIYIANTTWPQGSTSSNTLFLYCLKSDGSLNWKKTIDLSGFNAGSLNPFNRLQSIKATKDKGIILTISVMDNDFPDSYYFKIDSLGNTQTVFTSITNRQAEKAIKAKVYPNPSQHKTLVEIEQEGVYNFKLVDGSGKVVLNKPIEKQAEIDLSTLSNQAYFYIISTKNKAGKKMGKLVKK